MLTVRLNQVPFVHKEAQPCRLRLTAGCQCVGRRTFAGAFARLDALPRGLTAVWITVRGVRLERGSILDRLQQRGGFFVVLRKPVTFLQTVTRCAPSFCYAPPSWPAMILLLPTYSTSILAAPALSAFRRNLVVITMPLRRAEDLEAPCRS